MEFGFASPDPGPSWPLRRDRGQMSNLTWLCTDVCRRACARASFFGACRCIVRLGEMQMLRSLFVNESQRSRSAAQGLTDISAWVSLVSLSRPLSQVSYRE